MTRAFTTRAVIAGPDPAIHLLRETMDARVKPAHDDLDAGPTSNALADG
jgi:hypothetical protein